MNSVHSPVVVGRGRTFGCEAGTDHPDQVWRLWTDPSTWQDWDEGLRGARLDGAFEPGAVGELTDLSGRVSRFTVTASEPGLRCTYEVRLPGARLVLTRTLTGPPVLARHEVAFTGPLTAVWALVLGRDFRRRLGPTVAGLVAEAGRRAGPGSPDGGPGGPESS